MESLARAANRGSISTGYDVENSCRFHWDASSGGSQENGSGHSYMTDTTWTGTPTSTTTGCFSTWFKNSLSNATNQYNVASFANNHADSSNRCYLMGDWGSGGNFVFAQKVSGSWNFKLVTNALYRDPSAWYHFFAIWDTSNATEGERIKMYVNGERITSFSGEDYPSQNQTVLLVDEEIFSIGRAFSSVYGSFTHGYMAETALIDGTAYAVTKFGETDEDSGIWKPKDISGLTFGTKGFYLDYKDSSNLGNDVSGNNRDLALTSIDSSHQTTDTPTNNFCTLMQPQKSIIGTEPTVDNGNTRMYGGGSGTQNAHGSFAVRNGKWYYESTMSVLLNDSGGQNHGFGWLGVSGFTQLSADAGDDIGKFANGWSMSGSGNPRNNNSHSGDGYSGTAQENVVMGCALDMDNGKIWWSIGGTWITQNSGVGNPATGAYPSWDNLLSVDDEPRMPAAGYYVQTGVTREINFGNPSSTIFTGVGTNADENGYGSFSYAPPSGFYALCTKNLAEYG